MPNNSLLNISNEQISAAEKNLADLDKILKNKVALVDSGVFTSSQIEEVQATYDSVKKIIDITKKNKV